MKESEVLCTEKKSISSYKEQISDFPVEWRKRRKGPGRDHKQNTEILEDNGNLCSLSWL